MGSEKPRSTFVVLLVACVLFVYVSVLRLTNEEDFGIFPHRTHTQQSTSDMQAGDAILTYRSGRVSNYTTGAVLHNGAFSDNSTGAVTRMSIKLIHGFREVKHMMRFIQNSSTIDGLPYRYTPPLESGLDITGTDFDVDPAVIRQLRLPPVTYFKLSDHTVRDFEFVTAADSSHYEESMDCVASIQTRFPGYVINYYDIGLSEEQKQDVLTWCNVKLDTFPFDDYPRHVRDKDNKCFKYLIIQQALTRHGAVFWVDASFRALDDVTEWDDVFSIALTNGGVVMAEYKKRADANIEWTDPVMFYFLVTDPVRQIWTPQLQSGSVIIYNTQWAFTRVLWWMYLCSLEGRCCPRQTGYGVDGVNSSEFSQKVAFHNHCTDQSALNILLSNAHGFNVSRYGASSKHVEFKRKYTERYTLERC